MNARFDLALERARAARDRGFCRATTVALLLLLGLAPLAVLLEVATR